MSAHHDTEFPKLPLYTGAGLIFAALLLVLFVRLTGIGEVRTPQASVVAERLLRFEDEKTGGIRVIDAARNTVLAEIAPETNGFLRGTLRGLARERKRAALGPELPYRLTGRSDGRLLLEDPATHRLIDLGAFGPTNAAAFVRLLGEGAGDASSGSVAGSAGAAALSRDGAIVATRP